MQISVRNMVFEDIEILVDEFGVKQGGKDKTVELYTKYFNEQGNNQRQILIAAADSSIAGYLTLLPNDPHGPFAVTVQLESTASSKKRKGSSQLKSRSGS